MASETHFFFFLLGKKLGEKLKWQSEDMMHYVAS